MWRQASKGSNALLLRLLSKICEGCNKKNYSRPIFIALNQMLPDFRIPVDTKRHSLSQFRKLDSVVSDNYSSSSATERNVKQKNFWMFLWFYGISKSCRSAQKHCSNLSSIHNCLKHCESIHASSRISAGVFLLL